jgi:hypothetical protein
VVAGVPDVRVHDGLEGGEILALRREDLDLTEGTAITRSDAEGNKAKTDERVKLHPDGGRTPEADAGL